MSFLDPAYAAKATALRERWKQLQSAEDTMDSALALLLKLEGFPLDHSEKTRRLLQKAAEEGHPMAPFVLFVLEANDILDNRRTRPDFGRKGEKLFRWAESEAAEQTEPRGSSLEHSADVGVPDGFHAYRREVRAYAFAIAGGLIAWDGLMHSLRIGGATAMAHFVNDWQRVKR